jgi:PAS domain S-box-containing protein
MEREATQDKEVWQKMLLTAFQQSGEAILLLDYKGKIVTANPAARKLFGYNNTEDGQLSIDDLLKAGKESDTRTTIPDLIKITEKNIHGVTREKHIFPVSVRMVSLSTLGSVYALLFITALESRLIKDKTLQRRNAEITRLKESLNHLKNNAERALRDRTQILQETVDSLVEIQKQLRQALGKEIEANEKCSKFAYLISHEYRNPLTFIHTSLDLIERYGQKETPLGKAQLEHLQKAREQVKQLVSVTDELLFLNAIRDGSHKLKTTEVEITELLDKIAKSWSQISKDGHNINIRLNLPEKVVIETNGDLLKQALNNLVSNAVKYSDGNGEVVIECDEDEDACMIKVKDQGRGIPREELHKLSNGFYRASNSGDVSGNGLGLFIVRQFLEHLNGKLELASELNLGTCATIRLPKKYEEKSIAD